MSTAHHDKLDGIATSANNYTLPTASAVGKGGVRLNYTESGKNYPVEIDSNGDIFVNVPWSNTTYSVGDGGLTTNDFTNDDHSKLNGIELGATADQTAVEIIGALNSDLGGDFTIGSQSDDDLTLSGGLVVGGALTVNGTQTILNTATIEVEDKTVVVAKNSSPDNTSGNDSGLDVMTSTTATNNPYIHWQKNAKGTGWVVKPSGSASAVPVATIEHHATSTPSSEESGGIGSFWFENDSTTLYIRIT